MSWRYSPTPESSEGAGLANSLLLAVVLLDGVRGVPLVCDTLRARVLEVGVVAPVARLPMLPSQAGFGAPPMVSLDLTLAFAWLSSELPCRREVGVVVCARRLGPRTWG